MIIKIGDRIRHQLWGGKVMEGIIEHIEICKEGEKYGRRVVMADTDTEHGVVDVSNGKWCYFDQIKAVL